MRKDSPWTALASRGLLESMSARHARFGACVVVGLGLHLASVGPALAEEGDESSSASGERRSFERSPEEPPTTDVRNAIQLNFVGLRARTFVVPHDNLSGRRTFDTLGVSLLQMEIDARDNHRMVHSAFEIVAAGGDYGDGKATADLGVRGAASIGYLLGNDGGPFFRAGAALDIGGTRGAGRVAIELPRLELGAHWLNPTTWRSDARRALGAVLPHFFEAGPTGSLALVNAAWLGPYTVDYGVQPTWGGFAVAQWSGALPTTRLRFEIVRAEAIGLPSARPLLTARGRLCTSVHYPFAICAEAEASSTSVPIADATFSRQTAASAGILLAFGNVTHRGR